MGHTDPSGEPRPGTGQDRRGGVTPLASLGGSGLAQTPHVPVRQPGCSHTATRASAHSLARLASAARAHALRGHGALTVAITTLPSAQGGRGPPKFCPLSFPGRETGRNSEAPAGPRTAVLGKGLGGRDGGGRAVLGTGAVAPTLRLRPTSC